MTTPDDTGSHDGARPMPEPSETKGFGNWWKRRSVLQQVAMIAGVIVAAIVAWHVISSQITSQDTAQHERDLGSEVKTSMQHDLDNDSNFSKYHLQVTDVTLIKADGNRYDGMATVHGDKGIDHKVLVHVTAGDNGTMWQTENGAFLWVIGEQWNQR